MRIDIPTPGKGGSWWSNSDQQWKSPDISPGQSSLAADENATGVARRTNRAPDSRALHHMREAAGVRWRRGPTREFEGYVRTPTRAAQTVAHAKSPAPIPLGGRYLLNW